MQFLIGVGSNRGDRVTYIRLAAEAFTASGDYRILAQAAFLDNPAQGGPSGQLHFLNSAWLVETDYGPHQLLHRLQEIESSLGRVRTVHHGARTIDLDVLLCDAFPVIDNVVLQLPHPAMHERSFVLQPAAAIAPDWIHPSLGLTMSVLNRRVNG